MDPERSLHFPFLVRICNSSRQAKAIDMVRLLPHLSPDFLGRRKEWARSTGDFSEKNDLFRDASSP